MRLLRYGPVGRERPGALDDEGNIRDLSAFISDVSGDALSDQTLDHLKSLDLKSLPRIAPTRLGACIAGVGKIICIGLNYHDHAAETDAEIPTEPIVFFKATSTLMGPDDQIEIPRRSEKTDWEVELAVIIGRRCKYVNVDKALDYVAGYAVTNDMSERDFQHNRGGQWVKGKSADTFGPLGPWLVTRDEVPDPQRLSMWLDVNGVNMQRSNTANMAFSVEQLISYLSQFMSLHPGDVISTGTPAGVGMGLKPPRYLKEGDRVELGIDGLGRQCQVVKKSWAEA